MTGRPLSAADPVNADRIKTATWDLYVSGPGGPRPVRTMADLAAMMDFAVLTDPERVAILRSTTRLPSWRAAPPGLRAEVDAYLAEVKDFDPGKHPRDRRGRFTDTGLNADNPVSAAIRDAMNRPEWEQAILQGGAAREPGVDEFGRHLTPAVVAAKEKAKKAGRKPIGKIGKPPPAPDIYAPNQISLWDDDFPQETLDLIVSTFERDDWPGGMRTVLDGGQTYITRAGDTLQVSGDVYVPGRRTSAGRFTRTILPPEPGHANPVRAQGTVHNNFLQLDAEIQGQGFAEEFYRHVETAAADNGIGRVAVYADIDVGGYAWARRGFDWNRVLHKPDVLAFDMAMRMRIDQEDHADEWTPLQRSAVDVMIDRLMEVSRTADWDGMPTPAEIAALGEDEPWTETTEEGREFAMWPGKQIMLGSEWNGVKPVLAGFERKDAAQDWRERVMAFLPIAEAAFIPRDRYRPHDGLTSDYNLLTADLLMGPGGESKAFRRTFARIRPFNPAHHPRDAHGRFVDVPDVILPDGSRGVAVGTDRHGKVTVAKPDGDVVSVEPRELEDPGREPTAQDRLRTILRDTQADVANRIVAGPLPDPADQDEVRRQVAALDEAIVTRGYRDLTPPEIRTDERIRVWHARAEQLRAMAGLRITTQTGDTPDAGLRRPPAEPPPFPGPTAPANVKRAVNAAKKEIGTGESFLYGEQTEDQFVEDMVGHEWQFPHLKERIAENERLAASFQRDIDLGYDEAVGPEAVWSEEAIVSLRAEVDRLRRYVEEDQLQIESFRRDFRGMFQSQLKRQGREAEGTLRIPRQLSQYAGEPSERVDKALGKVISAGRAVENEARRRAKERITEELDRTKVFDKAFMEASHALEDVQRADRDRQWREKYGGSYTSVGQAVTHALRRAEEGGDVERAAQLIEQLRDVNREYYDLDPDLTRPEVLEAHDRYESMMEEARIRWREAEQKWGAEKRILAEERLAVLAEIRPMGGNPPEMRQVAPEDSVDFQPSNTGTWNGEQIVDRLPDDLADALDNAMDEAALVYPAEWNARVAASDRRPEALTFVRRGFNATGPGFANTIALSPMGEPKWSDQTPFHRVAVHEYGHAMEHVIEGLTALEWAFHWKRTAPKPNKEDGMRSRPQIGPNAITPIFGKPDEVGAQDRFRNHYSGKVYADSPYSPWELFTTAAESLFAGSEYLDDDDDFAGFALGILATL